MLKVDDWGPGTTILTLNRPEKRNALCIQLLEELCTVLVELSKDRKNRVVILTGAGNVFSAGLDLQEASNPDLVERSANCVEATLSLLRAIPLITIAAVHGRAFAGGAGVMTAWDMAVGSEDLRIGFPEARRGLLPALICDVLRPKVRESDLRELFLVGNTIDANRAMQIGLLQRVVPTLRVVGESLELAIGILEGGPETIRLTKQLLNNTQLSSSATAHSSMIDIHLKARHSDEAREGLAAFLEKRKPSWMVE